jgi:hypothetical protein
MREIEGKTPREPARSITKGQKAIRDLTSAPVVRSGPRGRHGLLMTREGSANQPAAFWCCPGNTGSPAARRYCSVR